LRSHALQHLDGFNPGPELKSTVFSPRFVGIYWWWELDSNCVFDSFWQRRMLTNEAQRIPTSFNGHTKFLGAPGEGRFLSSRIPCSTHIFRLNFLAKSTTPAICLTSAIFSPIIQTKKGGKRPPPFSKAIWGSGGRPFKSAHPDHTKFKTRL